MFHVFIFRFYGFLFLRDMNYLKYVVGLPQEKEKYFNIFSSNTHLLFSRLIAQNFRENPFIIVIDIRTNIRT